MKHFVNNIDKIINKILIANMYFTSFSNPPKNLKQ